MLNQIVLVALGGAIGSVGRQLVNLGAARLFGPGLPLGTFTVNLVGAFAMGVFIELLARRLGGSAELRVFVATGIIGGFTTFSSFALDTAVLWERGEAATAFAYVAGTLILGFGALFAGLALARHFA
ncbi:putative fluoride ion transporter CrcB [Aureimonas endophytica]|uniref:Fluoride-specific ion channel FluC n=1 Tax=Aureimonas endophytica TaxID=2027858 RepID=A0A916ZD54_9HYPH|nr:fluoride efflux transporter CrcB [Aureimonas endophytica]GGD89692.1 putative fluoride ion transporter CrcB [Aureimonas endophytica]